MTLSVIIPVYKVEKFLRKCVESVLAQGVDDMEIILVDDRSPDRCGEICDALASENKQVRAIHRDENGGLSAARNTGIDAARGDYITFVDSDDFIAAGTYLPNLSVLSATGADVVEFPVAKGYGSAAQSLYAPCSEGYREESFANWMARDGFVHSYSCNKIYRRKLWERRRFPAGKYFEDLLTVPYLLHEANKIAASGAGLYCYCDFNDNAITKTPSLRKQEDIFNATVALLAFLREDGNFSDDSLYSLYMTAVDRQIDLARAGGGVHITKFPLRLRHLLRSQTASRRLKALAILACGNLAFKPFVKK